MTNKLALVKKTHKNTQKKKLNLNKQAYRSPVRTAQMNVHMTVYNYGTQYSSEQF